MSQTIATQKQIACIGAICGKMKMDKEQKQMIVEGFSGGRCTSSKDLSVQEALKVIQHLKDLQPDEPDRGPMVRKIFAMCHDLGWTKVNGQGKKVANGKRFDEWAVKNSYLKKSLDKYTYAELPKLVSQFQYVYRDFLKKY
jgi:hypothetical protein